LLIDWNQSSITINQNYGGGVLRGESIINHQSPSIKIVVWVLRYFVKCLFAFILINPENENQNRGMNE